MREEEENACGKVGCYYYVEDYKCSNDHVSKSELRRWCEERKKESWVKVNEKDTICFEKIGHDYALNEILETFCKGDK